MTGLMVRCSLCKRVTNVPEGQRRYCSYCRSAIQDEVAEALEKQRQADAQPEGVFAMLTSILYHGYNRHSERHMDRIVVEIYDDGSGRALIVSESIAGSPVAEWSTPDQGEQQIRLVHMREVDE